MYRQMVRGKISAIAIRMIEDMVGAFDEEKVFDGEKVRFRFVINADGSLGGFEILDEKTEASQEFRDLALKVVETAAPFNPVPREVLGNHTGITYVLEIRYME